MAITSKEYIQILGITQDLYSVGLNLTDEQVEVLDEVRKMYKKYKAELDYLVVYPRHGIEEAQLYANEILTLCRANDIEFEFGKLDRAEIYDVDDEDFKAEGYTVPWDLQESRKYITFKKNTIDITELLAF